MTNSVPTLNAVTIFKGNGSILVKYELSGPVPVSETFLVGVHGKSQDGEIVRQFGIKFLDGDRAAYFVFNHNTAKQENFDYIRATEDSRQILTPYPESYFSDLGENPKLEGYLNYAGDDRQTKVPVQIVK